MAVSTRVASAEGPTRLARFVLDHQSFALIECDANEARTAAEILRFDINGATIAVVEDFGSGRSSTAAASDVFAKLTGRELQVAALVAQGNATKNIAHKLRISEWTVGTYLRRIFAKLNVDNRAAMVYLCAPLLKNAGAPVVGGDEPQPMHHQVAAKTAAGVSARKIRNEDLAKV